MPNGIAPPDKPKQSKPFWEYAFGGLLWGIGFFGAGYLIKRISGGEGLLGDDDEEED